MKNLKSQEGFTLVELMVVVAIIGILSAVAIPNFRSYQAKSKASEARLQLSSLYQAQTTLLNDFDSYGTCLTFAGFETPNSNYYAIGFSSSNNTANGQVRLNGGTDCLNNAAFVFPAEKRIGGAAPVAVVATGSTLLPGSFTGGAAGNISKDNITAANNDTWTIDENKVLLNTRRGY